MNTVVGTDLSQCYRLEMLTSGLTLQHIIEVLISYKLKGVVTMIYFIPVLIARKMPGMPLNQHSISGIVCS